jgi:hypothetical protein
MHGARWLTTSCNSGATAAAYCGTTTTTSSSSSILFSMREQGRMILDCISRRSNVNAGNLTGLDS